MQTPASNMNWKARLYLKFVIVGGFFLLIAALAGWESTSPFPYAIYLGGALMASRLKIGVPGVPATISLFFVLMLFGIMEWSLPATLFLACTATLVQSLFQSDSRPKAQPVLFNVANIALATATSYYAYHSEALRRAHVDSAPLLLIATVVFFLMNTFPVAAVIALRDEKPLRLFWKDTYFWSFPNYALCAAFAGTMTFVTRSLGWQTALFILPVLYFAQRSYSLYISRVDEERSDAQETAALHLRTIEALALAIEAKDHTTHQHLRRVQVYAVEIGKELGLSKPELQALRVATVLRDIGKLAVPEHILSKPGNLTDEEFEKMKIHPAVGAEILEGVRFPYPVTPIVRSHHEKWNGSGYPDGLRGEDIPLGARILATVDCLHTLASDRQYRRALPLEEAMRQVAADAGGSFDPAVVQVLEKRCAELDQLARSQEVDTITPRISSTQVGSSTPVRGLGSVTVPDGSALTDEPGDFLSHIASAPQEVQALFELAQDIGASLSLNETLSLVAIRLKRIIAYDSLAIYVARDQVLRAEYVNGEDFRLFSELEIPMGQGLSGWVAEKRKPIINGNPAAESGYLNDETKFSTMRSAISVPLLGFTGVVSVLTLYRKDPQAFTGDHLRILLAIAPKVGHAIENALKYQQAESSAATDYMTSLPNARSLFLHLDSELARCRRAATPLVVLVCDMNGFKGVNDRFGHLEGNRVLRTVATKIKECCREYDYVARMGGDEFVLVFPELTVEQAKSKIVRLRAVTKEAGQEVCGIDSLSLSIGAAAYPADGSEAEQLISEADRRMYLSKQKDKLRVVGPCGYDFDHSLVES